MGSTAFFNYILLQVDFPQPVIRIPMPAVFGSQLQPSLIIAIVWYSDARIFIPFPVGISPSSVGKVPDEKRASSPSMAY